MVKDIALDEMKTVVTKTFLQFVIGDIHPEDFPILLPEDCLRERAADETVGTKDQDAFGHVENEQGKS
jgi:hypothetical protein